MISNRKMHAQKDPTLGKLGWFFRGKRHQDSLRSRVVCFSAIIFVMLFALALLLATEFCFLR